LRIVAAALLAAATWVVCVYPMGTAAPPPAGTLTARDDVLARSQLVPRAQGGVNTLTLFGTPYERGLAAGRLTKDLLLQEETQLVADLERFFPSALARWALMFGSMRWFYGIDRYISPSSLAEMYGVAASAPHQMDRLADGYTRQIAYHGVHEIGQMFVDFDRQDFGCTAVMTPTTEGWIVGRNFDFDAVPILDTEKIVKWAFPDAGHAYVAVTWAGMVGTVTGVNDRGVYVSINAAGTTDFRRIGTPTTLVALEALERADSAAAAVQVIEAATTFITDIFVVVDREGAFVVEKTPKRVQTRRYDAAHAVTNHLTSDELVGDSINRFRMGEQTTVARLVRANELLGRLDLKRDLIPRERAGKIAAILRDKRGAGDAPLSLGHRNALDALIATHSVVYDTGFRSTLWVSAGPALVGPYVGFDLAASFAARRPVRSEDLEADPEVDVETFTSFKSGMGRLRGVNGALREGRCDAARADVQAMLGSPAGTNYEVLMAAGDFFARCDRDAERAKAAWRQALADTPAYRRHKAHLEEALR
jgi:predicted choloylglycine hydrolase